MQNDELNGHDPSVLDRRRALRMLGGAGLGVGLVAVGLDLAKVASAASGADSTIPTATEEIPDETGGPFPADGTNGVNALSEDGVVRSDITSSFGAATGVADGIPLQVVLNVQDLANGGDPLTGAARVPLALRRRGAVLAVLRRRHRRELSPRRSRGRRRRQRDVHVDLPRVLHGTLAAHPLRGLRRTSRRRRTAATRSRRRSSPSRSRWRRPSTPTTGTRGAPSNLGQLSLQSDMVFADDGAALQLATMSGDNDGGYTALLAVGV